MAFKCLVNCACNSISEMMWYIAKGTCWMLVKRAPTSRGVYSDTTQLNSTQLTQLNSVHPSQSCFCLWRHDLQTESTGSLRSLIGDSCSRCERVDNLTSSWVELSRVAINGPLGSKAVSTTSPYTSAPDHPPRSVAVLRRAVSSGTQICTPGGTIRRSGNSKLQHDRLVL